MMYFGNIRATVIVASSKQPDKRGVYRCLRATVQSRCFLVTAGHMYLSDW